VNSDAQHEFLCIGSRYSRSLSFLGWSGVKSEVESSPKRKAGGGAGGHRRHPLDSMCR